MKVVPLLLITFSFLLTSSLGYVKLRSSGSFVKRNLRKILNSDYSLTSLNALSRQCHDKYMPQIRNTILQGKNNMSECVKKAEQFKANEIESTRIIRESLNEKFKYATSYLGSCIYKYEALEYYACLEFHTPLVQKTLTTMATVSALFRRNIRIRFDTIENEEKCCMDNVSKDSERNTERLLMQLENCLIENIKQERETINATENIIVTQIPVYTDQNFKRIDDNPQISVDNNITKTEENTGKFMHIDFLSSV